MALNFHKRNKGFVAVISAGLAVVFLISIVMTAVGSYGSVSYQSSATIEEMIKSLEGDLAKKPKDLKTLVDLGNYTMNLADTQKRDIKQSQKSIATYQKAADYYKRAIEIDAKDVNVRTDRSISLFYGNKVDEAIKEVEEAIKISPKFANAHFNYGIFLSAKGDFKKAVEELKLAKELEPAGQFVQSIDSMLPQFEQMLQAQNSPSTTPAAPGTKTTQGTGTESKGTDSKATDAKTTTPAPQGEEKKEEANQKK